MKVHGCIMITAKILHPEFMTASLYKLTQQGCYFRTKLLVTGNGAGVVQVWQLNDDLTQGHGKEELLEELGGLSQDWTDIPESKYAIDNPPYIPSIPWKMSLLHAVMPSPGWQLSQEVLFYWCYTKLEHWSCMYTLSTRTHKIIKWLSWIFNIAQAWNGLLYTNQLSSHLAFVHGKSREDECIAWLLLASSNNLVISTCFQCIQ